MRVSIYIVVNATVVVVEPRKILKFTEEMKLQLVSCILAIQDTSWSSISSVNFNIFLGSTTVTSMMSTVQSKLEGGLKYWNLPEIRIILINIRSISDFDIHEIVKFR